MVFSKLEIHSREYEKYAEALGMRHQKGILKIKNMPDLSQIADIIKKKAKQKESQAGQIISDNIYEIENVIESILEEKHLEEYVKTYEMAEEIAFRTRCKITEEAITVFVKAYEKKMPLRQEELCLINCTLKLALLNRISDICKRKEETQIDVLNNVIESLNGIDSMIWESIISELSVTENILKQDPAGIFEKMTLKTKNEYLRILSVCAARNKKTPEEYANILLKKSQEKKEHIGKFLYEEYTKKRDFGAFAVMFIFTAFVLSVCPVFYTMEAASQKYGIVGIIVGIIMTVLIYFVSINVSFILIQKMYIERKMPFLLPEMDFDGKLPQDCTIMIVLPCLINSKNRIDNMVMQLQAAAWANPQEGICYTLLADLPESRNITSEKDSTLIKYAKKSIEKLGDRFHICIRTRVFYESDKKWRGYERKRGALIELNRKIINAELPRVKYVLTVDADTIIPVNTALKMAQIMYHPLNQPKISYKNSEAIVTEGYAILQPNIKSLIGEKEKTTLFQKIYAGKAYYSYYDSRVSDFYFDTCHEGIFTGKGMYDPYIFNGILEGRFPDNTILSHDLLEGSFLRVGYASDIYLYDEFPSNYISFMKRQHRWIRGDWQLLPVMKKRYCDKKGIRRFNPINRYSKFKMLMNIIRSLYYPAMLLLFTIGAIFLPEDNFLWIFILIWAIFINIGGKIWEMLPRALMDFVFLPHKAFEALDAAFKALKRTFVTGKNMLEWEVSSEADKTIQDSPLYFCRKMWVNFTFAAIFALLMKSVPAIIWLVGPYVAYFISQKPKTRIKKEIASYKKKDFRLLARKIWAFYDDYAVENENYLPPDNIQMAPFKNINHKTSPTNIGFLITGTIIAEKMGYITFGEMAERLERISATIDKMEKWEGHIYNWYDCTTLQPIEPKYVSTVDSGNLAACLLTAAEYVEKYKNPYYEEKMEKTAMGLYDTICCLNEYAETKSKINPALLEDYLSNSIKRQEELLDAIRYIRGELAESNAADMEECKYRKSLEKMLTSAEMLLESNKTKIKVVNKDARLVGEKLRQQALNMNFQPLYNKKRKHLDIGYDVSKGELSGNYYDIFMSEARLASYIAISKGDIEPEHLLRMARKKAEDGIMLKSWSGTAFEYMMPEIFMPSPENSEIGVSITKMLMLQQKSMQNKVWGVSESAYNEFDVNLGYKYYAFGLKSAAVKKKEQDDKVISPYSSLMASNYFPEEVYQNMERMKKIGMWGMYGLYEAYDFTEGREGIVKSYMAHHMGMALCGIANLLEEDFISKIFSNMPMLQGVKLMLTQRPYKS